MTNTSTRKKFATKTFIAALALAGATAALSLSNVAPAAAQSAYDYPWCAYYSGRGGGTNCYFSTRGQCMVNIQGIGGICQPNPFYDSARYEPRRTKRARHHYY